MIDKRPAVIAQCRGAGRIADAVRAARELELMSRFAAAVKMWRVPGSASDERFCLIDLRR